MSQRIILTRQMFNLLVVMILSIFFFFHFEFCLLFEIARDDTQSLSYLPVCDILAQKSLAAGLSVFFNFFVVIKIGKCTADQWINNQIYLLFTRSSNQKITTQNLLVAEPIAVRCLLSFCGMDISKKISKILKAYSVQTNMKLKYKERKHLHQSLASSIRYSIMT